MQTQCLCFLLVFFFFFFSFFFFFFWGGGGLGAGSGHIYIQMTSKIRESTIVLPLCILGNWLFEIKIFQNGSKLLAKTIR